MVLFQPCLGRSGSVPWEVLAESFLGSQATDLQTHYGKDAEVLKVLCQTQLSAHGVSVISQCHLISPRALWCPVPLNLHRDPHLGLLMVLPGAQIGSTQPGFLGLRLSH